MAQAHSTIAPAFQTTPLPERHADALLLRPRLVFGVLLALGIALGIADIVTLWLDETVGSEQLRRIFNVVEEQSLPTWFSAVQLYGAHLILAAIAWVEFRRRGVHARYWLFLCLVLLVLSIDEVAGFHETGRVVMSKFGIDGNWVVPGAAVAGLVGVAFIPFLLALPRKIAAIFCLAGALLLGGAIGVEVWDLSLVDDEQTFRRGLVPALEESLERAGISVFILGLLLYVREHLGLRGVALS